MELWRDIVGYEGYYQVSNKGRVRSLDRIIEQKGWYRLIRRTYKGSILKQSKEFKEDGSFYFSVELNKNGVAKRFRVHRLVAMAFIPNPNNLPIINHKDENKANNCVDNLEWCDIPYNVNYGTAIERRSKTSINCPKRSRKIYQYTLDGELVRIWPSRMECQRNGFNLGSVYRCCKGLLKQYKGYRWSYEPL